MLPCCFPSSIVGSVPRFLHRIFPPLVQGTRLFALVSILQSHLLFFLLLILVCPGFHTDSIIFSSARVFSILRHSRVTFYFTVILCNTVCIAVLSLHMSTLLWLSLVYQAERLLICLSFQPAYWYLPRGIVYPDLSCAQTLLLFFWIHPRTRCLDY